MDSRGANVTLGSRRFVPSVGSGRARHTAGASSNPRQLAGRLARTGRLYYLPLLLSDQGRMILVRKYDAFTTDRAYENHPHGKLGPIGAAADALVLRFPVHATLRRRLPIVVDAIVEGVQRASDAGADQVRILSAPCGLARDVLLAAERLGGRSEVIWTGVDLDERGDVLPEAARRARKAGVRIELLREDLFVAHSKLEAKVAEEGRFHVINCIGLASWTDLSDVKRLIARFRQLLVTGGTLLIDSWRRDRHARLAPLLELPAHYHDPEQFHAALEATGFRIADVRATQQSACAVWIARRR